MKLAELKKLVDGAAVEVAKERDEKTQRVYIEDLNREFYIEATTAADAKKAVLEIIINESDRIRGFELEGVDKD